MEGLSWGETIWKDLRYGARLLRVNPGFAAVASYLPALRASRVDPMTALRDE